MTTSDAQPEGIGAADDADAPAHRVSTRIGPGSVSATRVGTRTYQGLNERGATVLVGPPEVPGAFTPGELLKLALAACAGMSGDSVLARRLGDDVEVTVWAHGTASPDNRYPAVDEELLVDLSALDPEERARLIAKTAAAIERRCTVARSVEGSIALSTTIDGEPVGHGPEAPAEPGTPSP